MICLWTGFGMEIEQSYLMKSIGYFATNPKQSKTADKVGLPGLQQNKSGKRVRSIVRGGGVRGTSYKGATL